MKKFFSWVVLVLCSILSLIIIAIFETLAFKLGAKIYDMSSVLFWIIIVFGGTFGLGLECYFCVLFAGLSISVSQKVDISLSF